MSTDLQSKPFHLEGKKSNASVLLFALVFLAFFRPPEYAIPDLLYTLWRTAALAISLFALLIYVFRFKITLRWFAFFVGTFFMLILSSGLRGSDRSLVSLLDFFVNIIGFLTCVEIGLASDKKRTLYGFIVAGTVMLCLYFISFLQFTDIVGGMRHGYVQSNLGFTTPTDVHWYFLTYDNNSIFYFLPLLVAVGYCAIVYDKRLNTAFVAIFVCLLIMYIKDVTVTALIALAVFVVSGLLFYQLLRSKGKIAKNLYALSLGLGLVFCAVLVLCVLGGQATGIADLLGKDASFSGREGIWAKSIESILEHPIFGAGVSSSAATAVVLGQSHCHNIVLQLLFNGGIVTFLCYLVALFACRPKGGKYISGNNGKAFCLICAAVLAYFIVSGLDWLYANPIPYLIFLLAYYATDDTPDCRDQDAYARK